MNITYKHDEFACFFIIYTVELTPNLRIKISILFTLTLSSLVIKAVQRTRKKQTGVNIFSLSVEILSLFISCVINLLHI